MTIEVQHLEKVFPVSGGAKVHALQDVTVTIREREIMGLVGESGSGKSTLGRSILRLLDTTGGRILFDGRDITHLSRSEMRPLRRDMQMIFQDPFASLNPRMTVGEIIGEPLRIHGGASAPGRQEQVAEMLRRVGLSTEYMARYPHQFSGGQRQRIGIARALILHPKFVVADEPVSALDVSVQAQVVELIQELQQEFLLSMLFVSHDLAVVERLCHRVAVLYLGRIMELAPARALSRTPKHPYTQALLSAAPVPDPKAKRQKIILQGEIPSPLNPPSGCVFRTRCPYAIPECAKVIPELREVTPGHFKACIRDVL